MSEETIRILRAGSERVDDLEPLWKALHDHHREVATPIPAAPWRETDDSWPRRREKYLGFLAQPDAFVLVAEDGGRPVAYALVTVSGSADDTNDTGDRWAELQTLSVLPRFRVRGLGTRMLEAVYAELRPLGVRTMSIGVARGNDDALHFYARHGFTPWITATLGPIPPDPRSPEA